MQILSPIVYGKSYHGPLATSVIEKDGTEYQVTTMKNYQKKIFTSFALITSRTPEAIISEPTNNREWHGEGRASAKKFKTLQKDAITKFFDL